MNNFTKLPIVLFKISVLLLPVFGFSQENRTIDGSLNQVLFGWGRSHSPVITKSPYAYADGISAPAGQDRPSPRHISNVLFQQNHMASDPNGLNSYVWAWGQFIDHDITLSANHESESLDIKVPANDPFFDPFGTGNEIIPMHRSAYDPLSGTTKANPRTPINEITSFIDGSAVYGSDQIRAKWLRTFSNGKLKTSQGNLLPFNTIDGEYNSPIDPDAPIMDMPFPQVEKWFVAGDFRANENPFLTSIHTILVREHNRLCESYFAENPTWDDEKLYQKARKIVSGLIQSIVYEEWLPTLGVAIPEYQGYNISVNPGILNEFSTAAYRYGHSTIAPLLLRADENGAPHPKGDIQLRDAFFNPETIIEVDGIEPYIMGGVMNVSQDLDCKVIDDLRNFLFGPPGAGGLDLVALNINRGRDRGLADYNSIREAFGLSKHENFQQITSDLLLQKLLEEVYGDINNIDAWVGMLAEDHQTKALFGPTAMQIIEKQFTALRDGDRYYYENDTYLSSEELADIKNTRLAEVLRRNTGLINLPDQIFKVLDLNTMANRTIDGNLNNPYNRDWGAAHTLFEVNTPLAYTDDISIPAGDDRPNARMISNGIFAQHESIEAPLNLSAFVWAFGQFIDHDITLSENHAEETYHIKVPAYDAYFDPSGTGSKIIPMFRSKYDTLTGTDISNPRIAINSITAFIDGSAVYGSDQVRANWLRTFTDGKLKISSGNLLPYNTVSGEYEDEIDLDSPPMDMPFPTTQKYFVAGDLRANENPILTSIHTVFVREHNRLCDQLVEENPDWTDEMLYQKARKLVGAKIQAIVYEEWLPVMGLIPDSYSGYDASVHPGIMNVFAVAAFRYGHTTIGPNMMRMNNDGEIIPEGIAMLRDAFFNPDMIPQVNGIDPYLMGMSMEAAQDLDCFVIDDLRNFLFGAPGSGGMDLVSININRGRERGLADYNTIRTSFGLDKVPSFDKISSNFLLNQKIANVYQDVELIDPWVGILAEDHMPNALFGPTAMRIIKAQFEDLRSGDRFYYEADPALNIEEIQEIKETRLADIIRLNTSLSNIHDNVFVIDPLTTAAILPALTDEHVSVFPNPTTDFIQVDLKETFIENAELTIQIIDNQGRIHFQKEYLAPNNLLQINLKNRLNDGYYYVRISDKNKFVVNPFIKTS